MTPALLTPREVDLLFRYPTGRSRRLARQGKLPHIILPDGEIRFVREVIAELLRPPAPDLSPMLPAGKGDARAAG
jgi:hypothetical protein